jgi:orotidine-5'-phosphate decarboxylase
MTAANPVFAAIDTRDLWPARQLCTALAGNVGGVKLGLEFFGAHGPSGVRALAETGLPVFLDLKFHDIPNTVAQTVKAVLPLEPAFLTVHASGGPAMIEAAAEAAAEAGSARPRILAVTVLTSLDDADLAAVGQEADAQAQVARLARLARDAGADGAVCSPLEVAGLRNALGGGFVLMVPGIRPEGAEAGDQKRVMTPREAMAAGASHLVIGRPITRAPDPAAAARAIAESLG